MRRADALSVIMAAIAFAAILGAMDAAADEPGQAAVVTTDVTGSTQSAAATGRGRARAGTSDVRQAPPATQAGRVARTATRRGPREVPAVGRSAVLARLEVRLPTIVVRVVHPSVAVELERAKVSAERPSARPNLVDGIARSVGREQL